MGAGAGVLWEAFGVMEDKVARTKMIRELFRLGINRRTIFPDLEGISKGIWQTEVLWHGN